MLQGGLFITLYDEKTLRLYLTHGVYGQHMPPEPGTPSPHSNHYRTLGDYACARDGNHVFFFRDRTIYYGGQIKGPSTHGAFYLNGTHGPLGREADAPLVWDESVRDRYNAVEDDDSGLFKVKQDNGNYKTMCQPYLIRFEDEIGLAGASISSDDLYFSLGEYPYPLPSNSISGMGFCTLTPGETQTLLSLMEASDDQTKLGSDEEIDLQGEPTSYSPEYGVSSVEDAHPESHLEAAVLANPSLLPPALQPSENDVACRQVPISPFKPRNMDQADVCYFSEDPIRDGTIPNTIIELKNTRAGKSAAVQIVRYLKWLHKRLGGEADKISVYAFAPSFTSTFDDYIPAEFRDQIQPVAFDGSQQQTL